MNKLVRKITLSGVALGVAAISATTSTFAWFTTNTSATASEVNGSVKDSGSNMLIKTISRWYGDTYTENSTSTTATADTWSGFSNSVSLKAKDNVSLKPVTWGTVTTTKSGGSTSASTSGFYKGSGADLAKFETEASETDYLHYQVIFGLTGLGTGATNSVTMSVSDFTDNATGSQYLLVDADSTSTGAKAGDTITVNLLDVLSMRVNSTIIDSSNSNLNTYGLANSDVPGSSDSYTITQTNQSYRYRAESDTVTVASSSKNGDALTYYNNVYSKTVTRPNDSDRGYAASNETYLVSKTANETTETAKDITLFTIKGNEKAYVLCDIYFYVDGWDKQCFNCVGGLNLTGGKLNFSLNKNQ